MTISSVGTQPVLILEVPSLYLEQLRPLVGGAANWRATSEF
jgi:hypothetical protein